jgi:hypothetical protein
MSIVFFDLKYLLVLLTQAIWKKLKTQPPNHHPLENTADFLGFADHRVWAERAGRPKKIQNRSGLAGLRQGKCQPSAPL